MATAAEYLTQLQALLPPGAAWPRESEATLTQLLAGLAEEFARVDQRAGDLQEESDPRTTTELLGEWERAFGLPDECATPAATVQGRQLALHQKVASLGGQSKPYFVSLAALLGYEVDIHKFRPLRLPFTLPERVAGRPWAFSWRVDVYGPIAAAGEPPAYASVDLECVVRRAAASHTIVSFSWSPDPEPTLLFDFLTP